MYGLIFVALLVASCAAAQRPSFAGSSPKGVPDLAARFRPEGSQNEPAQQDFVNRLGGVDATTVRLPIDAGGDVNLVNRINTWPDENKPFWFVNAEAIEKHRNTPNRPSSNAGSQSIANGNQAIPVNNNNQFENRFATGNTQSGPDVSGNSFNIVINNQWKTYVYDPKTDAWYAKRN